MPELVADTALTQTSWSWRPRFTVADICRDAWRFQQMNPNGYQPVD